MFTSRSRSLHDLSHASRHGAAMAEGGGVGAHPVVGVAVHRRGVHGGAPVARGSTASHVERVPVRLGQRVGVVLAAAAVVGQRREPVRTVVCVDPDADHGVVAVEALHTAADGAACGRCTRGDGDRHPERHQQSGDGDSEAPSDRCGHGESYLLVDLNQP